VWAEDTESSVNLSSLTSFVDSTGYSSLTARDGGSLGTENLTTLEGLTLTLDGATSSIDLTNLDSIDGLSFYVNNGAVLDLS
ncbi:hypothetical protein R0J87_23235, partial [Halomonas sp. SIMBA_159]